LRTLGWLLCVMFWAIMAGSTVSANGLPPLMPVNPMPADGGDFNPDEQNRLTWELGEVGLTTSSLGDMVRYDVFFGKTGQMTLAAQNLSEPWFQPGELEAETEYQWQVISRDYSNQVVIGPIWTFRCIQWIQAGVDGTGVAFRCLKPGRYAALAYTIRVASNDPVGLRFGPNLGDLAAAGDHVPTWYTFGQNIDQALKLRGWIRARDLSDRCYPGVFPSSQEGTEVEVWMMINPSSCNGVALLQSDLAFWVTKNQQ